LVQPSVYGFDNDVLLDALSRDPARLRGVAVVRPEIFDEELRSMDRLGVRGVRVNTRNKSGLALSAIPALASKLAKFSWLLQLQVNPDQLTEIVWLAARLEMPVVLDHLGFIPIGRPDTPRWVGDLQRLLDTGNCYVKLSAPYRLTNGPPYAGFGNVVRQLANTHADRLLWGSDWPHTELFGAVPDDAELVDFMQDWLGSEATQHRVFVANPEALFFSR
jgi:predicted TIM-barrel fold metal-dependent hydrolase